jgi:hypothetical protein
MLRARATWPLSVALDFSLGATDTGEGRPAGYFFGRILLLIHLIPTGMPSEDCGDI